MKAAVILLLVSVTSGQEVELDSIRFPGHRTQLNQQRANLETATLPGNQTPDNQDPPNREDQAIPNPAPHPNARLSPVNINTNRKEQADESHSDGKIINNTPPVDTEARANVHQPDNADEAVIFPDLLNQRPPPISCVTEAGESGTCKPLIRCAKFYFDIAVLQRTVCALENNMLGVCCPLNPSASRERTGVLASPPAPLVSVPSLSTRQLNNASEQGLVMLRRREQQEKEMFNEVTVPQDSATAHHQDLLRFSGTQSEEEQAQRNLLASIQLVDEFSLNPRQGTFGLTQISVRNTIIRDTCPLPPPCPDSKYRTMDGSCNNRRHKDWGKTRTAMQRILPPAYGDGVNSPRLASDGSFLPSARLISSDIIGHQDKTYQNYTLFLMQWGQFLDHDLTHTPISRGRNNTRISCCDRGRHLPRRSRHPECFPISIPHTDTFYAPHGQECMAFVRSLPARRPDCTFGPREQMDQITGFIDASNIYGSTLEAARLLREFRGGRLVVQRVGGRELLPANPNECARHRENKFCFKAGDARANEQIDLTVVHTVWMRQHNLIARHLEALNPSWNDEQVYQETRRIVAAQIQHITYNEFLPIVLGINYMHAFGMLPLQEGHSFLYNDSINPSITNVFASAAYRFGHTLIPDAIPWHNRRGGIHKQLPLHKQQFAPYEIYEDGALDGFVRGLITDKSRKVDNAFGEELTNHLFQNRLPFGLDLVALNIQRGRDHGLPPYNDWRELCGLPRASRWEHFHDTIDPGTVRQLRRLYRSVDDVDLYVAGVSERPLPGAILGHTFLCLVGDQFARLKRGDRFYYEEGGQLSSFTEDQLAEIRRSSLSRVLCDNSDDIPFIQPLSFLKVSPLNPRTSCGDESRIPRMSLRPWSVRRSDERPIIFNR